MFSVNSLGFLVFLAVFVPLWFTARPDRRWQWMLAANLLFYLSIDVPGLFVLLASAALVWLSAKNVRPGMPRRRRWIALGLFAALAPLLLLKYSGMFADAAGTLLGIPLWDGSGLLQPLGLAYFSLQLASYLIDVSRGDLAPEPLYARVLCYASFFFSITQGPFNRYGTLMPQLAAPTRFDSHRLWRGAMRMAWGYFKKYAIAERAAVVVSAAFSTPEIYDTSQLVFGTVLYSFQLYADFSGYTDIVLGAGEILGLRLPENFRQPFLAATVRELWSRWHISLSQWFRDYVYIPLGGNRKGTARRDANLILTFLASGLWHGANWTYLVWGGLHGGIQAIENHLPWRKKITRLPTKIFGIAGTFTVFVVSFTIFRADSIAAAAEYFRCLVTTPGFDVFSKYWELGLTSRLDLLMLLAGIAALVAVDILHECGVHLRDRIAVSPLPVRWLVYECALFAFLLMGRFLSGGAFLYARY